MIVTSAGENAVLTFPAGAANPTNSNDVVGLGASSITVTADGYTIAGEPLSLGGGVTVDPTVTGLNTLVFSTPMARPAGPSASTRRG